jgi:hypothetical protein
VKWRFARSVRQRLRKSSRGDDRRIKPETTRRAGRTTGRGREEQIRQSALSPKHCTGPPYREGTSHDRTKPHAEAMSDTPWLLRARGSERLQRRGSQAREIWLGSPLGPAGQSGLAARSRRARQQDQLVLGPGTGWPEGPINPGPSGPRHPGRRLHRAPTRPRGLCDP